MIHTTAADSVDKNCTVGEAPLIKAVYHAATTIRLSDTISSVVLKWDNPNATIT